MPRIFRRDSRFWPLTRPNYCRVRSARSLRAIASSIPATTSPCTRTHLRYWRREHTQTRRERRRRLHRAMQKPRPRCGRNLITATGQSRTMSKPLSPRRNNEKRSIRSLNFDPLPHASVRPRRRCAAIKFWPASASPSNRSADATRLSEAREALRLSLGRFLTRVSLTKGRARTPKTYDRMHSRERERERGYFIRSIFRISRKSRASETKLSAMRFSPRAQQRENGESVQRCDERASNLVFAIVQADVRGSDPDVRAGTGGGGRGQE